MRLLLPTPATPGLHWHVLNEHVLLEGYQLYAVERWIVQKDRLTPLLVVFTGDMSHTVSLSAVQPSSSLSEKEQMFQWDHVIELLRDNARPKETPHGTLMVTSLAHFRSDLTIVHIPSGNFLQVKDLLYTNINLLRMGCRGRTTLTLEQPSDTTRDKFATMYHFPPSALQPPPKQLPKQEKDSQVFLLTVMELVKQVQAALFIYGLNSGESNGLLCDSTLEGLRAWTSDVGKSILYEFQSSDRIAGPVVISALLSSVLSIRNKLAALGYNNVVPKDPFLHPQLFTSALSAYVHAHSRSQSTISLNAIPIAPAPSSSSATSGSVSFREHSPHLSFHAPPFISHQSFNGHASAPHTFSSALSDSAPTTPGLEVSITSPTPTSPNAPSHTTPPNQYFPSPFLQTASGSLQEQFLSRSLLSTISTNYSTKTTSSYLPSASRAKARLRGGKRTGRSPGGDMSDDNHPNEGPDEHANTGLMAGFSSTLGLGMRAAGLETATTGMGGGGNTGGAATIMEPILDLREFVRIVVGDKAWIRDKRLGRNLKRKNDGGSSSLSNIDALKHDTAANGENADDKSSPRKSRENDRGTSALITGTIAGSVRALWTGRAVAVLHLRETISERRQASDKRLGVESLGISKGRERHRDRIHSVDLTAKDERTRGLGGLWSDGDGTDDQKRTYRRNGNLSTEDESDLLSIGASVRPGSIGSVGSTGGLWGKTGKVRGKLESWTGFTKLDAKLNRGKRSSIDLSPSASPSHTTTGINGNGSRRRSTRFSLNSLTGGDYPILGEGWKGFTGGSIRSRPQSPTDESVKRLGVYANEDDDLLSSGQASPVEGPSHLVFGLPMIGSSPHESTDAKGKKKYALSDADPEYEKRVAEFVRKRPWANRPGITATRVSSWSDPVSAMESIQADDGLIEHDEMERRGSIDGDDSSYNHQRDSTAISTHSSVAFANDVLSVNDVHIRKAGDVSRPRRRSFHEINSLRNMLVLPVDKMKIDVDISGQVLVFWRREPHLQNVVATLQLLTSQLSNTNVKFREEYHSRLIDLAKVEQRTKVLTELDAENAKADKISQATNSLWYESAQFDTADLLRLSNAPRQRVLQLRHKVFGAGGRKLAPGVHGAHGRFNRLQWTLDGQERLVDALGRTESEAEEEAALHYGGEVSHDQDEEGEEDGEVVENPRIKPMWLLKFFTSWVTRWSSKAPQGITSTNGTGHDPPILPPINSVD